jgi:hypothetical protein
VLASCHGMAPDEMNICRQRLAGNAANCGLCASRVGNKCTARNLWERERRKSMIAPIGAARKMRSASHLSPREKLCSMSSIMPRSRATRGPRLPPHAVIRPLKPARLSASANDPPMSPQPMIVMWEKTVHGIGENQKAKGKRQKAKSRGRACPCPGLSKGCRAGTSPVPTFAFCLLPFAF